VFFSVEASGALEENKITQCTAHRAVAPYFNLFLLFSTIMIKNVQLQKTQASMSIERHSRLRLFNRFNTEIWAK